MASQYFETCKSVYKLLYKYLKIQIMIYNNQLYLQYKFVYLFIYYIYHYKLYRSSDSNFNKY